MRKIFTSAAILLAVIFIITDVQAQKFTKRKKYTSVGGSLNAMNYVGDLDPGQSFLSPNLRFTRYNLSACIVWRMQPRISIRTNLAAGRIMGDDRKGSKPSGNDKFRWNRNLSFRNDMLEFKLDAIFDLFENRGTFKKRPDYTPYAFIGFAMFFHNPKAKFDGKWVALKPLKTEGQGLEPGPSGRKPPKPYSLIQPAIPFGVGFRYKLDRQLDIAFEIGWRATFTDYIDDVGGFYYDRQKLIDEKGIKAAQLADRSLEGLNSTDDPDAQTILETHTIIDETGAIVSSDLCWDWDNTDGEVCGNGKETSWYYVNGYGHDGDQRGDLRIKKDGTTEDRGRKDWYIITGFHLTYILKGQIICPKFR